MDLDYAVCVSVCIVYAMYMNMLAIKKRKQKT